MSGDNDVGQSSSGDEKGGEDAATRDCGEIAWRGDQAAQHHLHAHHHLRLPRLGLHQEQRQSRSAVHDSRWKRQEAVFESEISNYHFVSCLSRRSRVSKANFENSKPKVDFDFRKSFEAVIEISEIP